MKMIVLNREDLQYVLSDLANYRPRSLQMESIIRKELLHKYSWPGIEYVADQMPDYSVIFTRQIKGSPKQAPWSCQISQLIFSKDDDKLRQICREEGFADWSKPFFFVDISKHDVYPIIVDRCNEVGQAKALSNDADYLNMLILDPKTMEEPPVPSGYRLGTLAPEHASQINSEWHFGCEATLSHFQYLIENRFPNSAIFEESTGKLVAYIMLRPDGCNIGHGFVHPEHRRKGLFQVVNYHCAKKVVEEIGMPYAWVFVMKWNEASRKAYERMGSIMVKDEDYAVDCVVYQPKGHKSCDSRCSVQ